MILKQTNRIIQGSLWWYDPTRPGGMSGTTLYDLSGNGEHAIWNVTPSSDGDGKGVQITTYQVAQKSGSAVSDIVDLTMTIWFKALYSNLTLPDFPIRPLWLSIDGNNVANHITVDINDGHASFLYWNGTGSNNAKIGAGFYGANNPLLNGEWVCYTFKRNTALSPMWYHYVNGQPLALTSSEGGLIADVILPSNIGTARFITYGDYSGNLRGSLGACYGYDRALSDAEIRFNYNVDSNKYFG